MVGKVVQIDNSSLSCPKRWFSLLINTPHPSYSMLGYKRTGDQWAGKEGEKEVKPKSLINTFDNDCEYFLGSFQLVTNRSKRVTLPSDKS